MFGRKEIGEVFTPRNSQVNGEMYIERHGLEKELYRSVKEIKEIRGQSYFTIYKLFSNCTLCFFHCPRIISLLTLLMAKEALPG